MLDYLQYYIMTKYNYYNIPKPELIYTQYYFYKYYLLKTLSVHVHVTYDTIYYQININTPKN